MNEFVASNGAKVEWAASPNTSSKWLAIDGNYIWEDDEDEVKALREFFRHEEDERLGRWRSTADPTWTAVERNSYVYLQNEDHERTFHFSTRDESTLRGWSNDLKAIGREYLAAHREPKPWHDAKEGETWVLTFRTGEHAWFVNGDYFQSTKTLTNILKGDSGIIAARRIWPEPTP